MGIFKPKKPSPQAKAEVEADQTVKTLEKAIDGAFDRLKEQGTPKGTKETEIGEVELTDVGGGMNMIEGKLPEGFDSNNPKQVRDLIGKALKGVFGDKAQLKSVEVVKGAEGIDTVFGKFHTPEALGELKEIFSSDDGTTDSIPLPQDPLKASFVGAYNNFHKAAHALAPLAKDLITAMEALRAQMPANATEHEKKAFGKFELALAKSLTALAEFADATCGFGAKIASRGIPVPDVSSTTVN